MGSTTIVSPKAWVKKNSQNDTYWLMAELSQHPKTQKAL